MSRLVPIRAVRIAAFAAAVVVAGWTAERAEATCGSYVYVRGQKLNVDHASMADDAVGQGARVDGRRILPSGGDAETPRRMPCNGPTCSNRSFPPVAPVPSEPVSTEQWACSISYGLAPGNSFSSLLPASDAELSEGVGLSIIRPPR